MLSKLVGPFQVKEYFHWVANTINLSADLQEDLSFLSALRQLVVSLPYLDRIRAIDTEVFPPPRPFEVKSLAGKKIGIVASGGSGAMISTLGVMRACEEAGLEIAAMSACSGSALYLAPVAAGLSAQETVNFVLGWRKEDYLDPEWSQLFKLPLTLGRGFTGVVRLEALERLLHERLGGVLVGDLPIPFYANIWEIDHNRLLHMGTRTTPDMRLARLVRTAITLPLYIQTVEIDGAMCGDGGVLNIFPVEPLVEHHPEIDFFIGVNAIDYSGYPDCRPEYIEAYERMARLATKAAVEGRPLTIHAPLAKMSKADIVRAGVALGLDHALTSSCYDPAPDGRPCGHCDSCLLRARGFAEAGVEDPLLTRFAG